MILLILSLGCYIATAISHVIIHRVLAAGFGIFTPKSFFVFVLGSGITAYLLYGTSSNMAGESFWEWNIPMSAWVLYLLCSAGHFLFFMSFFFDARSPSTKLLFLVRRHGPLTREEILMHFSDTETVINRVNTLLYEGFLVGKGSRLFAAQKAMPVARFMAWYRKLMKWERGG